MTMTNGWGRGGGGNEKGVFLHGTLALFEGSAYIMHQQNIVNVNILHMFHLNSFVKHLGACAFSSKE